jgi:NAD(P)-dependent dehydrogenase (short-subunit alcohol dehydrogenase family)
VLVPPSFTASHTFLVTGASSGIGRSVAQKLLDMGATVIASGRDAARLETLRGARPVVRDLSADIESLPAWVEQLANDHGPLSGIVHSAGILGSSPLRVLSAAFTQRVMELNLFAFLMLAKGLVQTEVPQGASLLCLSSVASLRGLSGALAYSASKGAVNAAVLSLSAELAPLGIRCNAILPGVVETEMTRPVEGDQIDYLLAQQFVPGRIQPADVAALAAFLLSDAGRFVTGQLVTIDAGSGNVPGPRPHSTQGAA